MTRAPIAISTEFSKILALAGDRGQPINLPMWFANGKPNPAAVSYWHCTACSLSRCAPLSPRLLSALSHHGERIINSLRRLHSSVQRT
eukprot:4850293-Prymnesium_polylepis.1